MRTRRILTALTATAIALATLVVPAAPAYAGGWAVTVLDPLPDRLEAGQGYTVGLWVLQHGYHPYEGDLGPVALRLVDDAGTTVSFPATRLPEAAHYATAIAVPHPGTWTVIGVQGLFAPYHIGDLTVPGSLAVLGAPATLKPSETAKYWPGPIRPPTVAVDTNRDPFAPLAAAKADPVPAPAPVAAVAPAPASDPAAPRWPLALAAAVVLVVGLAAVLVSRRWWRPLLARVRQ